MQESSDDVMAPAATVEGLADLAGSSSTSSYIGKLFQRVFDEFIPPRKATRSNNERELRDGDSYDDSCLLRDAMLIEYLQPGSYKQHHVLKFKYSVSTVRKNTHELPPGLKDNEYERTLYRAVCDKLHLHYHGAYTTYELKDALFACRCENRIKNC